MCINQAMKIVPNKFTIFSCLINYNKNNNLYSYSSFLQGAAHLRAIKQPKYHSKKASIKSHNHNTKNEGNKIH